MATLVTRGRAEWIEPYAILVYRTGMIVRLRPDLPRLPVR